MNVAGRCCITASKYKDLYEENDCFQKQKI